MRKYLDILKKGRSVGLVLLTILAAITMNVLGPLTTSGLKNVLSAAGTDEFHKALLTQVVIMLSIIIISEVQIRLRIAGCNKLTKIIKPELFGRIIGLPVSDLHRFSISRLTTIVNCDTRDIITIPAQIIGMVIMFVSSVTIMVTTDTILSVITLICTIPLAISVSRLRKKASELANQKFKNRTLVNSKVSRLEGYLTIKSFGKEDYELNNFTEAFNNMMDSYGVRRLEIHKPIFVTNIIDMVIAVVIIMYVTRSYTDTTQMVANGLLFYGLQSNIFRSILCLPDIIDEATEMMVTINNISEIMDKEPDKDGSVEIEEFEDCIEFKDVAFSYENSKSTLYNVNMTITKGTHVGIYGPSGGGKTSLLNLVNRFYRVDSGEILIDGVNINKITNKSLRKIIGNVNQEIFIFSDMSIKDNIKYGIDCSDEDVIKAAKAANAHEFITKLERGYDSIVGNNGVLLSGGERQRIAIARLFLLDPPILLLDEATSKLDNTSERLIKESLQKLSSGKTVISIAHRLNTIQDCDMLVGIKNHTIYEYGTSDYVKNAGKLWRELATVNCD